MQLFFIQTDLQ